MRAGSPAVLTRQSPELLLLLFRMLARLPLRAIHAIGSAAGLLTYGLSRSYRSHLCENLALAYPQGVPPRLGRDAAREAGRMVLEMPRFWLRDGRDALALVREVRGWEGVETGRSRGGVLLLTPHLGCFEVLPIYIGSRTPMTIMYRPPRKSGLGEIVRRGRMHDGIIQVPADVTGVRKMTRALKDGGVVGMLPDQVPAGGQGAWAPFFGRPAYTMTLAARFSMLRHISVLFAVGERLPGGAGYILHFLPPPIALEGDLETRVAAINGSLEILIRRWPVQYLWGYNRYKKPRQADADSPAEQG